MKGTFFSADFIIDENNSPRIIELNTDTACITSTLDSHFDFSGFKTLCSDNNITKITIIYKEFQSNFVNSFESYIESDMTFITEVDRVREANSSIYTTLITDESDRFILRMAYDENAVFDSTYCKDRINLLNIFNENGVSGSTPEYYYSGSGVEYNTFMSTKSGSTEELFQVNSNHKLPDVVEKPYGDTPTANLHFTKFTNSYVSASTDLYNDYLNNYLDKDNYYTEKFHISTGSYESGSVESIRMFGVVYGAEINFLQMGSYKIEGMWDLPTNLDDSGFDIGSDAFVWKLPNCHYYELTTNFRKSVDGEFVMDTEKVQLVNSSFEEFSNLAVSQSIKSYYISGSPSPNTDDLRFFSWSHDGNTLPSESALTSSIVTEIYSESYDSEFLVEINLDAGDGIYVGENKAMLVYDSGSNEFRFKRASNLTASVDYLIDENENKIGLNSVNFVLPMSASNLEFMRLDVEETDTYFVSASTPFIVHNAPCFVAGTSIHTEDGVKNIEDVKVGDKVITYNHNNDTVEYKEVLSTLVKENENVVTYVFENGTELTGTTDHPLFVLGKGYSSYSPQATKDDSGLDVEQILIGDEVLHLDGYGVTITDIIEDENTHTVYNLDSVADNHNFFANDLLAHNRDLVPETCFAAGTKISLGNGDTKNIEDVVVGDEVLAWNGEEMEVGVVSAIDHRHTVDSHAEACERLGDEPSLYTINDTGIEFTPEHPFLTKEGWKSLMPDIRQEPYKSEAPAKELKVGDFILKDGEWEEIKEIKVVRSNPEERVYNFTVDKLHSYIANGIVVHNK